MQVLLSNLSPGAEATPPVEPFALQIVGECNRDFSPVITSKIRESGCPTRNSFERTCLSQAGRSAGINNSGNSGVTRETIHQPAQADLLATHQKGFGPKISVESVE